MFVPPSPVPRRRTVHASERAPARRGAPGMTERVPVVFRVLRKERSRGAISVSRELTARPLQPRPAVRAATTKDARDRRRASRGSVEALPTANSPAHPAVTHPRERDRAGRTLTHDERRWSGSGRRAPTPRAVRSTQSPLTGRWRAASDALPRETVDFFEGDPGDRVALGHFVVRGPPRPGASSSATSARACSPDGRAAHFASGLSAIATTLSNSAGVNTVPRSSLDTLMKIGAHSETSDGLGE